MANEYLVEIHKYISERIVSAENNYISERLASVENKKKGGCQ